MTPFQQQARQVSSWLPLLLAFSLPLSTSVISVAALLILACWLIEGGFRQKWGEIATSPFCLAVLIYFGILLVGLCWTDDRSAGLAAIIKQWKLLLVPVLLTTVRWELRWRYVAAFLAGMTVVMVLICLAWLDLLVYIGLSSYQDISLFTNHIVFTPMLALAIYLLLHQVLWSGIAGWKRCLLLALACIMVFSVFITLGRTGQLVFFMLLVLLLFQYFRRNLLKASLLTLILLPLIFAVGYRGSPIFRERMNLIQQNIATIEKNPDTSVGLRLLYWKNSWEIIRQAPWFGVGTGGFKSAYAKVNQQRSPNVPATDNPHNQYILTAVQQGLLGLLSLLSLFFVQIWQAQRVVDGWERIRLAFPLFFLVIMTTDCYLNTPGSGFLFSLFSAILCKNERNWQGCTQLLRVPEIEEQVLETLSQPPELSNGSIG